MAKETTSQTTTISFLKVQPASCRLPLPPKEIQWAEWALEKSNDKWRKKIERVMFFDPTKLYAKISPLLDPYKRHQGLQIIQLFPLKEKEDGKCRCGCKVKPKEYENGKYHMWATDECRGFTGDVLSIINNYFQVPAKYIKIYHGNHCAECPETNGLELDHVIGVKHGGGGCWLSNYRWLCHKYHRDKTNKDFGFKKPTNQLKLI